MFSSHLSGVLKSNDSVFFCGHPFPKHKQHTAPKTKLASKVVRVCGHVGSPNETPNDIPSL